MLHWPSSAVANNAAKTARGIAMAPSLTMTPQVGKSSRRASALKPSIWNARAAYKLLVLVRFRASANMGRNQLERRKVEALAREDGVFEVKGPMCRWQMMATDRRGLQGTGYVRKETGWMTNDEGLARVLKGVCSNESGKGPWHRHIHLVGGIAR